MVENPIILYIKMLSSTILYFIHGKMNSFLQDYGSHGFYVIPIVMSEKVMQGSKQDYGLRETPFPAQSINPTENPAGERWDGQQRRMSTTRAT